MDVEVGHLAHRLGNRRQSKHGDAERDHRHREQSGPVDVAKELTEDDRAENRARGGRNQHHIRIESRDADDPRHERGRKREEHEEDQHRHRQLEEREHEAARGAHRIDAFLDVDQHAAEPAGALSDRRVGRPVHRWDLRREDEGASDGEQRGADPVRRVQVDPGQDRCQRAADNEGQHHGQQRHRVGGDER